MMIAYKPQSQNVDKHPQMPDEYYFEKYEIDDSLQEQFSSLGYIVLSVENFNSAMSAIDLTSYNAAIAPTSAEIVAKIVENAANFGISISDEFKTENVMMGITQSGKTGVITKYLHWVEHFVEAGSLYEAIKEIDVKLTEGVPADYAPFITADRLTTFKNKIKTYLGIPL